MFRPAPPVIDEPDRQEVERFLDLSDKVREFLRGYRAAGIRSDREVSRYLCVDGAELSRIRNARVGIVHLYRAYDVLRKCDELSRRLAELPISVKGRLAWHGDRCFSDVPCVDEREWNHARAYEEKTVRALLTIGTVVQRTALDELIGGVARSAVHPRRNPYGPFCILLALRCVAAAPAATHAQLSIALRIGQIGRRACRPDTFNEDFDAQTRKDALAAILAAAADIAMRLADESPAERPRMLKLARCLFERSLSAASHRRTKIRAIECAQALADDKWQTKLKRLTKS